MTLPLKATSEPGGSLYQRCRGIDCSDIIQTNYQGVKYIPWADMWDRLLMNFPDAYIEYEQFDQMPYLKTEVGYFVMVSVTIGSVKRSELLPVMSHDMKAVSNPDNRDINDNLKRCFVKVCALHGLGIECYRKDDLYEKSSPSSSSKKERGSSAVLTLKQGEEFRFTFGKFKGRSFSEIPMEDLSSYIRWLKETDAVKNRAIVEAFVLYEKALPSSTSRASEEQPPPMTDLDIPF